MCHPSFCFDVLIYVYYFLSSNNFRKALHFLYLNHAYQTKN
uniref:Uncharacterized protein n=1 Tax=Anguilla anguilla TaxID=7936 RepID=A0A0E9PLX8_ANGAN